MTAEIITIGDEILIGQIIDTNSAWIAQQLNLIGIRVVQISSVQDRKDHILSSLNEASFRADLILITGGLGPTKDDITKTVLCEYFDAKLEFNKDAYEIIEKLFSDRNLPVTELNRLQAFLPDNCLPIINSIGTASGMWFEKEGKVFVSMPGVPFEMKQMMQNDLLIRIKSRFKTPYIIHKTVLTQGTGESVLAEKIETWENQLPEFIKLAYLPSPGIVKLRLSAYGSQVDVLETELSLQLEKLLGLISEYVFGFDEETLQEKVADLLVKNKATLAVAESCTGGFLSHLLTSKAGSSEFFLGSVVAYSNLVKSNQLGISTQEIEDFGVYSKEISSAMAKNVRKEYHADFSISTTGIAGPGGGSEKEPVGLVWISVCCPNNKVISKKFLLGENRERNILKASLTALNMLRKEILLHYQN